MKLYYSQYSGFIHHVYIIDSGTLIVPFSSRAEICGSHIKNLKSEFRSQLGSSLHDATFRFGKFNPKKILPEINTIFLFSILSYESRVSFIKYGPTKLFQNKYKEIIKSIILYINNCVSQCEKCQQRIDVCKTGAMVHLSRLRVPPLCNELRRMELN